MQPDTLPGLILPVHIRGTLKELPYSNLSHSLQYDLCRTKDPSDLTGHWSLMGEM